MRAKMQPTNQDNRSIMALSLLLAKATRGRRTLRTWLAQLLLAAIVCANLIFVPISSAQSLNDGFTGLTETLSDPDVQKAIQEELERQRLVAYRSWIDQEVSADMDEHRQFIEDVQMDKAYSKFYERLAALPAAGDRFSTNAYGTNYSVPKGSYKGDGLVGIDELWTTNQVGNPIAVNRTIITGRPGSRSISSGWSFEPGGFLKESYITVAVSSPVLNSTRCSVVLRYSYASSNGGGSFQQRGIEQPQVFDLDGNFDGDICAAAAPSRFTNLPQQFWSNDGQIALDMRDRNKPVMRYPDGTTITLLPPADNNAFQSAYIPFNSALFESSQSSEWISNLWYVSQNITQNGLITNYHYDAKGWVDKVTDARGRETIYERVYTPEYAGEPIGLVKSITAQGPGGVPLRWQMTWNNLSWNPRAEFPDITCLQNNQLTPCPNLLSYSTLTNLQMPDLRNYKFSYGPWGRLTRVEEPDGAVRDFQYGDRNTPAFLPPGMSVGNLPIHTLNLQRRRVTSTTIYPQGTGPNMPSYTTTFEQESAAQNLGGGAQCETLNWLKRTYPNGDVLREALCRQNFPGGNLDGQTFAQELKSGTKLVSGTYYGNLGTFGDSSTPIGNMYIDWETAHNNAFQIYTPAYLDIRPTKVVHLKDGVKWNEELEYESSGIAADPECTGCSTFRTTGNVVRRKISDGNGTLLSNTINRYFHQDNPAYFTDTRNLLRLPSSVRLKDGSDNELTRTEYGYDEFALTASGAPNRDTSIGSLRGNMTTTRAYRNPQNLPDPLLGTGSIATHTFYFDTGDVQQTKDANNNPTTMTYDFGACSPAHKTLLSKVTNAKLHVNQTLSDCYTGLTLRVTDANNKSTYSQYDNLGRAVEVAGPRDTLTPLPLSSYLRDTSSETPLSSGNTVGNGGRGPTTWTEYLSLGTINQQRVVVHMKDGTTNGRYAKTFIDGLGRTTQTRSEVDPATSPGNAAEVVATTVYDNLGRVSQVYVPRFEAASEAYTNPTGLATTTSYDALGRVTSVTPPGLPASITAYSGSGTEFKTTSTDAKGNVTESYTNVLGQMVRTSQQNTTSNCVGGWCTTVMTYDAAGRLIKIMDPNGNLTLLVFDGLGRKKQMTDPDMGIWAYDYDDNGNPIMQKDAKGQVIWMYYDMLNRMTRKDLPPNSSFVGAEDTTYFYDGEQSPS